MPDESNPTVEVWGQKISSELSKISGEVILVAHSVGGSILLRYLSDEKFGNSIGGLFVLAAPIWDDNQWNFNDLKLPRNIAEKLALIPRIFFTIAVMTRSSRSLTSRFTQHKSPRQLRARSAMADTSSATTWYISQWTSAVTTMQANNSFKLTPLRGTVLCFPLR